MWWWRRWWSGWRRTGILCIVWFDKKLTRKPPTSTRTVWVSLVGEAFTCLTFIVCILLKALSKRLSLSSALASDECLAVSEWKRILWNSLMAKGCSVCGGVDSLVTTHHDWLIYGAAAGLGRVTMGSLVSVCRVLQQVDWENSHAIRVVESRFDPCLRMQTFLRREKLIMLYREGTRKLLLRK